MSEKVETPLKPSNGKYVEDYMGQYRKMLNGESTIILKSMVHMRINVVIHIKLGRLKWSEHNYRMD